MEPQNESKEEKKEELSSPSSRKRVLPSSAPSSASKKTRPNSAKKLKKNVILDEEEEEEEEEDYEDYELKTKPKEKTIKKENKVNSVEERSLQLNAQLVLSDLKIVLTGVMAVSGREDLEALIVAKGGRIMSSVSAKTDLLVKGDVLEDGRPVEESSKYRNAVQKKIRILSEEEFLSMLQEKLEKLPKTEPLKEKFSSSSSSFSSSSSSSSSSCSSSSLAATANKKVVKEEKYSSESMLWVDKYKPKVTLFNSFSLYFKTCNLFYLLYSLECGGHYWFQRNSAQTHRVVQELGCNAWVEKDFEARFFEGESGCQSRSSFRSTRSTLDNKKSSCIFCLQYPCTF